MVLGVDIGTSSSKGVIVDLSGRLVASTARSHTVQRPQPGWVEMDPSIWWDEFTSIARELLANTRSEVAAVGVSGMGPCLVLADEDDECLRPAILYGVDTRASVQVDRLTRQLGSAAILDRCGSGLSSQALGPKIAWVAENEPWVAARARRVFMPSSWVVRRLTGEYVLDHHSASQCTPLYDTHALGWYEPWVDVVAPGLELPRLRWATEIAGTVSPEASQRCGIAEGVPVSVGTIDAWADAVGAGAHGLGDLMLMYGTTMFLINTVSRPLSAPALWGPVGALPGTRSLAGGMATSGAITTWLRDLCGTEDYSALTALADGSPPGANGLIMLPYFAGERTPIMDPLARGVIAGLTLSHSAGDLYRAVLEAIGFGVRHNLAAIQEAGGDVQRVVATGGGTQSGLLPRIVSSICDLPQEVPTYTIGASYGAARLAAQMLPEAPVAEWNPVAAVVEPDAGASVTYAELYASYLDLYPATRSIVHSLAELQFK